MPGTAKAAGRQRCRSPTAVATCLKERNMSSIPKTQTVNAHPGVAAVQDPTITIEYPGGRRLRYVIHGDVEHCDISDEAFAPQALPDVRDLMFLSRAQVYMSTAICEASEAVNGQGVPN